MLWHHFSFAVSQSSPYILNFLSQAWTITVFCVFDRWVTSTARLLHASHFAHKTSFFFLSFCISPCSVRVCAWVNRMFWGNFPLHQFRHSLTSAGGFVSGTVEHTAHLSVWNISLYPSPITLLLHGQCLLCLWCSLSVSLCSCTDVCALSPFLCQRPQHCIPNTLQNHKAMNMHAKFLHFVFHNNVSFTSPWQSYTFNLTDCRQSQCMHFTQMCVCLQNNQNFSSNLLEVTDFHVMKP